MKKKLMLAAGSILPALGVFAEGESATLDTTQAASAATAIKTGLTGLVTAIAPLVIDIMLAALGLLAIFWVARFCVRAWKTRG